MAARTATPLARLDTFVGQVVTPTSGGSRAWIRMTVQQSFGMKRYASDHTPTTPAAASALS
jgi:hypothetical protein